MNYETRKSRRPWYWKWRLSFLLVFLAPYPLLTFILHHLSHRLHPTHWFAWSTGFFGWSERHALYWNFHFLFAVECSHIITLADSCQTSDSRLSRTCFGACEPSFINRSILVFTFLIGCDGTLARLQKSMSVWDNPGVILLKMVYLFSYKKRKCIVTYRWVGRSGRGSS